MKKDKVLNIIGVILVLLGIASFISYAVFGRWQHWIWVCNNANLILGLAILYRNRFWATAEINLLFLPQLVWAIDYFGYLLTGKFVFNITPYMFGQGMSVWNHLLSLQHTIVFVLGVIAVILMKPDARGWMGSAVHGILLVLISYFIITPDYNVNCAYESCTNFIQTTPNYPFLWPIFFILFVVVPTNFLLVELSKKRRIQKKR